MKRLLISSLVLAVLVIDVLHPGARAHAQIPGMPVSSTQPNLSVTIHCDATTLKSGDEIPITFEITNNGNTPYVHVENHMFGRTPAYRLTATDESGTPVPDPRAKYPGGFGSEAVGGDTMQPGEVFTRVIALNRWALLTKPGTYHVTGIYNPAIGVRGSGKPTTIPSQPIVIVVQPRTDAEMAEYIKSLSAQLPGRSSSDTEELLQKLMFTCDPRIVPVLIQNDQPGNASFWVDEAFNYYLPKDGHYAAALIDAVRQHGMNQGMYSILKASGCSRDQIIPLIAISLSPDHPDCWNEAALAARTYADDSFMPRLIAVAMDSDTIARYAAIYALAMNRTDESVAALKQLLNDQTVHSMTRLSVSQTTAQAIRMAYTDRGYSDGRKLRPDDFPPEYQTMSLGTTRP